MDLKYEVLAQTLSTALLLDAGVFLPHGALVYIIWNIIMAACIQFPLAVLTAPQDASSHSGFHSADRVDWNKVTMQQAQNICDFLHDQLPIIPDDLVDCCDPNCNFHYQELDSLCSQLLECMQRGSSICLPKSKIHQHLISGWNSLARSLKHSAAFLA